MADVITSNLKLTKQTVGANENTWGTILNATLQLIDDGWGKTADVATTGGNTNLTDTEELVARINVTGVLGSAATLTFSGRGGRWIITNATTGAYTLTVKTSGNPGVEIQQGQSRWVFFDGTDMAEPSSNALQADLNLEDLDDASAALTNLGLSANGKSLVAAATYAVMRGLLDLEPGTDFYSIAAANAAFQPLDSDLTAIAAVTTAAFGRSLLALASGAATRALLDLEPGTDFYSIAAANAAFQPLDADLTAIAAVATQSFGRGILAYASEAAFKAGVNLEIGVDVAPVPTTSDPLPIGWSGLMRYTGGGTLTNGSSTSGSNVETPGWTGTFGTTGLNVRTGEEQTGTTWKNISGFSLSGSGDAGNQFGIMTRTA